MATNVPTVDVGVITNQEGRKSMLKLAERMVISFCGGVSASTAHTWTTLNGTGVDDVRVMTRKSVDDPGRPPGIVLTSKCCHFLLASSSSQKQPLISSVMRIQEVSERLLPPSIAFKNFCLRALGPLAGSSTLGARISPFSSVLGCSRLPPPVSARAVRVGCCSSSVVVSARICLPVSLESCLSHWHLVVRLSRCRRQKQLVGLSLASSPSVGWSPTRRRPLNCAYTLLSDLCYNVSFGCELVLLLRLHHASWVISTYLSSLPSASSFCRDCSLLRHW
ncbi:hypothetical protein Ahy_B03g063892 isoform C [Arachis hypogaea]|uniref:HD-Zip IV C-terminal domain-containing protein n=1 Tax=Arachis hypogaea TaxID=3818 RepID=A0A444ZYP2_ARAHY|nr:hypothetical protein Ahy_B03g063892 isoform C [Arachis hypogaea]